jgi:NitT/TauT family transport system permease protein
MTHSIVAAARASGATTHPATVSDEVSEPGKPVRRRGFWTRVAKVSPPYIAIAFVLVVWQTIVEVFHISNLILPAPTDVVISMWTNAPTLLENTWVTVQEILTGYGLSIVIGIPLAVVVISFKPIERALWPLLVTSQLVPMIALAPLFLVWFGFGILPKVLIVILTSFFPIVINSVIGLRSIETEKLYLAKSMGAGRLRTLMQFRLPQALPSIFGGLKVAATLAVIGAVIGEFVGSQSGLGYLIQLASGNVQTELMFAAIVYLTIVGIILYLTVNAIERLALPWHVSRRDEFTDIDK